MGVGSSFPTHPGAGVMEKRAGTLVANLEEGWTFGTSADGRTHYLAHPEHPPEVVYRNEAGEWVREAMKVTRPGPGEVIVGAINPGGTPNGFWLEDSLAWCSPAADPDPVLLISEPPDPPSLLTRLRRWWK